MAATFKQFVKRHLPRGVRSQLQVLRGRLTAPPSEKANLHEYVLVRDEASTLRLNLVIPTIAPEAAFGGVITGLDFFLAMGRRMDADLRVLLDDISPSSSRTVLDKRARAAGIDPARIELVERRDQTPAVCVRATDVFITFNWWVTLNVSRLVAEQARAFDAPVRPYIYLIQDYEPQFYPFSSSHMMARLALDGPGPYWAVFNATELKRYCDLQGHRPARSFVFEPRISDSLRPFVDLPAKRKVKRILVYGRPNVPRNCFPAVCSGLSAWIEADPDQASWEIMSAGMPHGPIPLARGREIRSVGKLALDEYARFLQDTAVGLSLMASPHPSYPPLEMAHFGVLTITNSYGDKNLGKAHDNVISINDIAPHTIANALSDSCRRFDRNPMAGAGAHSHMPEFLRQEPFECLDAICENLRDTISR